MTRANYTVLGKIKGRWESEWMTFRPIIDDNGDIIKYEEENSDPYHPQFYYVNMVELFQPIDYNQLKINIINSVLPSLIAKSYCNITDVVDDAFEYADEVIKNLKQN